MDTALGVHAFSLTPQPDGHKTRFSAGGACGGQWRTRAASSLFSVDSATLQVIVSIPARVKERFPVHTVD